MGALWRDVPDLGRGIGQGSPKHLKNQPEGMAFVWETPARAPLHTQERAELYRSPAIAFVGTRSKSVPSLNSLYRLVQSSLIPSDCLFIRGSNSKSSGGARSRRSSRFSVLFS